MQFDTRAKVIVGAVVALIVVVGVAVAVTAGGGGGEDEAATTTTTTSTTAPTTTTTAPAGPTLPLLGTPGEVPNRPALVVKLDNAPLGRPQAGLNQADVVYEEMVEGGITRLFTVFHSSDADSVGAVRSARSTDIALAAPLNRPLFSYSGTNGAFQRLLDQAPLVDVGIDRQGGAYHRERGRPAPYNLFTSTQQLWAAAPPDAVPPGPLFEYRPAGEALTGGQPAAGARVVYRRVVSTDVEWRFEGGAWVRTQNATAHVDAAGERVTAANVVIQLTPYVDTPFVDQSGEPVPEAELVGEGEVWVLMEGQVVVGRWRKPAPDARTEYLTADGQPIRLTPGRTWVELAPPGTASLLP
jgi:hypothetical protein